MRPIRPAAGKSPVKKPGTGLESARGRYVKPRLDALLLIDLHRIIRVPGPLIE
jgi:hypothetical protein